MVFEVPAVCVFPDNNEECSEFCDRGTAGRQRDDLFHSAVGNLQVRSGYLSWNLPLIKIFISVLKLLIKLITPSSGEFLHVSWSLCVKSSPPLSFHTLTSSSTSVLLQETLSEVTTRLFNQTF